MTPPRDAGPPEGGKRRRRVASIARGRRTASRWLAAGSTLKGRGHKGLRAGPRTTPSLSAIIPPTAKKSSVFRTLSPPSSWRREDCINACETLQQIYLFVVHCVTRMRHARQRRKVGAFLVSTERLRSLRRLRRGGRRLADPSREVHGGLHRVDAAPSRALGAERRRRRVACHRRRAEGVIRVARTEHRFDAARTRIWLHRVHGIYVGISSIQLVFRQLGLRRLTRTPKRRPRQMRLFSKDTPGESVQVDVKFVRVNRQRYFQYTALDDCTRFRVLRLYRYLNARTSLAFLAETRAALPCPIRQIQSDHGTEFSLWISGSPWRPSGFAIATSSRAGRSRTAKRNAAAIGSTS